MAVTGAPPDNPVDAKVRRGLPPGGGPPGLEQAAVAIDLFPHHEIGAKELVAGSASSEVFCSFATTRATTAAKLESDGCSPHP